MRKKILTLWHSLNIREVSLPIPRTTAQLTGIQFAIHDILTALFLPSQWLDYRGAGQMSVRLTRSIFSAALMVVLYFSYEYSTTLA